jgi:hypothetical protein
VQVADRVARYGIRLASQIPALEEFLPSLGKQKNTKIFFCLFLLT